VVSPVSSARSIGSVTLSADRSAEAPSPSTNFPTLRIFMASRRPTFICASSNGESAPGRAPAARHRTASVP
jgi:hypothetical protein